LQSALSNEASALFDRLRNHLLSIDGVSEQVSWHGPCWRWSVQYSLGDSSEPLALLIPSPEDFQLAVPFEREVADALAKHPFKRAIRDGLDMAREPFDSRWCVWSVQFANLLDDLTTLIDMKHRHVVEGQ